MGLACPLAVLLLRKLNGSKYFYVLQTTQLNIIFYTQLNDQTVLFLTIQFNSADLFVHKKLDES